MAIRPTKPIRLLLVEARQALGMTQREFGYALEASHRSATRWDAGRSTPSADALRKLAALLLPHDRALAVEAAAHLGETLVDLGLEAPPAPPPPPPPPSPPAPAAPPYTTNDLADIVVCAAAEATDTSPRAMRALLYVAFRRARQVGLSVAEVEAALARPEPAPVVGEPSGQAGRPVLT
jgi:hypothetical protein